MRTLSRHFRAAVIPLSARQGTQDNTALSQQKLRSALQEAVQTSAMRPYMRAASEGRR